MRLYQELECNLSSVCSANAVLERKLANALEATQALQQEKEKVSLYRFLVSSSI